MLAFNKSDFDLVHRLLNPFGFAAGQLAVFQGGPSRTGGGDKHI
jgi:hypothetical protein